jgi:PAS domain S-box-containing protein
MLFSSPVNYLAGHALLRRQVPILIAIVVGLLLALRDLRRPGSKERPERAILVMVCVLMISLCTGGWVSGQRVSEDLQYAWVTPLAMSAFMPWRPTLTALVGVVSLVGIGLLQWGDVVVSAVPFWKLAELMAVGTSLGCVANQLQRHLWQALEQQTRALEASRQQYRTLVETTQAVPFQFDLVERRHTYVGPQAGVLLGCSTEEWLRPGFSADRIHPDDLALVELNEGRMRGPSDPPLEFRVRRDDGGWVWVRAIIGDHPEGAAVVSGFLLDVTHQRQMEFELQQAQKLESVGRLAAGVAHEINTPIQFVNDSVHFVRDAFTSLDPLLTQYAKAVVAAEEHGSAPLAREIREAEETADLAYARENVPKALDRALDGLDRVAALVRSMKEFAGTDRREKAPADLNHALASTLAIARNEYKYVADVETDFGDLPLVLCHVNELNQAFLNIIVNAAHAIADVVKDTGQRGRIRITTRRDGTGVVISVQDTGGGIPRDLRAKVFEPFFTTKGVGRGTGQGLSIARNAVVDKHGGQLTFESEPGRGTTFFIHLPVAEVPAMAA